MSKKIKYSVDARDAMLSGIDKLARSVGSTLGPKGRNVIIERTFGGPLITKDGVTVAKEISLEDPYENLGVQLIKEAATKTNTIAGDGTTTATVLAHAIAKEGIKLVSAGFDPMELKRGMDRAVSECIHIINNIKKDIDDEEDIYNIANISANSDKVIGQQIAEAFNHIGKDGVITVEDSGTMETNVTYSEGLRFDRGYLSPYFSNTANFTVEYDNPQILLVERPVTQLSDLVGLLEYTRKRGQPLVIIAEDISGDALTGMIMNSAKGAVQVCAVRTPGFGERKKFMLEDIAISIGATVVSETLQMELSKVGPEVLGTCKKIKITSNSTTIVDGGGEEAALKKRIQELTEQMAATKSNYEREYLAERLALISGGVATINVGATTEVELKEKKHRVEDALSATRAALEDGIVAGGGSTLIHVAQIMKAKGNTSEIPGEVAGRDLFIRACEAPLFKIASNAGGRPDVVISKVIESGSTETSYTFGWNAATDTYGNMIEMGVIDPAKVTKSAVKNASSVAGMLLTTECAIIDDSAVSVQSNDPSSVLGGSLM